ncbi:MAG: glycerophosphodiester phosphodiesterase [Orrella sp.]
MRTQDALASLGLALTIAVFMPDQVSATPADRLTDTQTVELTDKQKQVIAHRGASGYLPEHTLAAKAMAHAQGADFLEQDLVMTRDGEVVVLHDITLDATTDVAARFTDRARADGKHYVIDFTLDELRTLRVFERRNQSAAAVYPNRMRVKQARFGIHTLAEELEMIQALNRVTGHDAAIYPEIKAPRFHQENGQDLSEATLNILKSYGYVKRDDGVVLQSFDARELQRIKGELMPALGVDLPLTQLLADPRWGASIGSPSDNEWQPEMLNTIATYADAVGVPVSMLFERGSDRNTGGQTSSALSTVISPSMLVPTAHRQGLAVHAYTLRADRLPLSQGTLEDWHQWLFETAQIDGVFTDFPDLTVQYLNRTENTIKE